MLKAGQQLSLEVEKPAVGGRMIARVHGQVVLVAGAIPGERVLARIERVGKGVVFAHALAIETPSSDRREVTADPLCGGCLYAPIAYSRQLQLKSQVITDALGRIGRIPWTAPIDVIPSPEEGYRLRARLHYRRRQLGWFREGTHDVCELRAGGQLLPDSYAVLERLLEGFQRAGIRDDLEVELSENVPASERVVHLESPRPLERRVVESLAADSGLTGFSMAEPRAVGLAHAAVLAGDPRVHDTLLVDGMTVPISRHVLAFFQGNRYLLDRLISHVLEGVAPRAKVVDLYAGAGLFALSAAVVRQASVVAVEGDLVSAADLALNAAAHGGAVEAVPQSVERFTARRRAIPDVLIVDPPRSGMSGDALRGVTALAAPRLVYVSCDVATLARDARQLVDAGYRLMAVRAFDLFPNTPHVETVARFER